MRTNLFNEKEIQTMQSITLDYIYSDFNLDKKTSHVASCSIDYHCMILQRMMEEGQVLYDAQVYDMLDRGEFYPACHVLTKRHDMIMQVKTIAPHFPGYGICYCPISLSEIEKIYLRKWYEFFQETKGFLTISMHRDNVKYYCESSAFVQNYLEKEQILDDTYMRSLLRKYPDLD
jgi:hypothetical protein